MKTEDRERRIVDQAITQALQLSTRLWAEILESVDDVTRAKLQAYDAVQANMIRLRMTPTDVPAHFALREAIRTGATFVNQEVPA